MARSEFAEGEQSDQRAERIGGQPVHVREILRRLGERDDIAARRPQAMAALDLLEVDGLGLDDLDRRVLRAIIENYDLWKNRGQYAADSSSILFDTTAIELLVSDGLMVMETLNLVVDDKGMTAVDAAKGRPVRCAMGWKDEKAFKQGLIGFLTTP